MNMQLRRVPRLSRFAVGTSSRGLSARVASTPGRVTALGCAALLLACSGTIDGMVPEGSGATAGSGTSSGQSTGGAGGSPASGGQNSSAGAVGVAGRQASAGRRRSLRWWIDGHAVDIGVVVPNPPRSSRRPGCCAADEKTIRARRPRRVSARRPTKESRRRQFSGSVAAHRRGERRDPSAAWSSITPRLKAP